MLDRIVQLAITPVYGLQKRGPAFDGRLRNTLRQTEIGHFEARLGGIGEAHGIVVAAQKRAAEVLFVLAVPVPLGDQHVRRNGVCAARVSWR